MNDLQEQVSLFVGEIYETVLLLTPQLITLNEHNILTGIVNIGQDGEFAIRKE